MSLGFRGLGFWVLGFGTLPMLSGFELRGGKNAHERLRMIFKCCKGLIPYSLSLSTSVLLQPRME